MVFLKERISRTTELLAETYGPDLKVTETVQLTEDDRHNHVHRLHLQFDSESAPATAILKYVPAAEDAALDRFVTEWVGTAFASRVAGIGPAYYGGDLTQRFVLMEDLGESSASLVEPLLGEVPAAAHNALEQHAALLGRLHAETAGQGSDYDQLHAELSGAKSDPNLDILEADQLLQGLDKVCEQYSVSLSAAARAESETLKNQFMLAPKAWSAFLHRDSCPDNVYRDTDELRLIDFQESRFGHVMLEAAFFRMCYPTCWCSNRLPLDLVERLERIHRGEAAVGLPIIADDTEFGLRLAEACWVWILITANWLMQYAQDDDGRWGIATIRPRIFLRLERFIGLAHSVSHLPGLTAFALDLQAHLGELWPDSEAMPVYPGLGAGAGKSIQGNR